MMARTSLRLRLRRAVGLAVLLTFGATIPTLAQTPGETPIEILLPADLDPERRAAFVDALSALERPVVLGEAEARVRAALGDEAAFAAVIARFDDAVLGIAEVPAATAAWWHALYPGGGLTPLLAVLALVVALGSGALVERGTVRLLDRWRDRSSHSGAERFAPRLWAALASFALDVIAIVAFVVGMLVVGWLLLPGTPGARFTLAVLLIALVKLRLLLALGRLVFAPGRRSLRLIPMPDDDAQRIWRGIMIAVAIPVAAGAVRDLLVGSGATLAAAGFLSLAVVATEFAARLFLFFKAAGPVHRLLLVAAGDGEGALRTAVRRMAGSWHLIFIALASVALMVDVYQILALRSVGLASAALGPLLPLILLPFVLAAYGALIDDLLIRDADGTRRAVFGDVGRTVGQGVILLVTLAFVARAFGIDPFIGENGDLGDRVAGALLKAAAAVLIGWALWHALRVFLEHELPGEDEPDEEGMGKPGSRVATLMPVLRSFLFVTIATISGLTALAAFGVEIGPLLAGAGVIGLAVGFGAQTLVQDVITGLFYLIEDAFRKGEYIETDAGKGVVEKISARSVRLRHHRGPLYTIPFGKMGNIVNHSRDWVKIKFELRVPFDTDVERVRKVIKKVGQEMLSDPVLGPMFLQPVKSQGVMAVDDYGFLIGVKFLCRPGEQFLIRREAYTRIKQAFVDNGIEFASPRVTVDSDSATGGQPAGVAAAAHTLPGVQPRT